MRVPSFPAYVLIHAHYNTSLHMPACSAQEVFLTQSHVCMAMEYAKGGDLYNYVKAYGHLKEPVARCATARAGEEYS